MEVINDIIFDDIETLEVNGGVTVLSAPLGNMTINSMSSSMNETIESVDVTDDDIETIDDDDEIEVLQEVSTGIQTRSGRTFASNVSKCNNCRQARPRTFLPGAGVGLKEVISDDKVNIMMEMDDEDDSPLQYKLTNFSLYCKEDEKENHLVPVFVENLLIAGKKVYLSGTVLRLDSCDDDQEGLKVKDIGPITMWSNATGMDFGHENIIINTEYQKKELEFNLIKPSDEYSEIYKEVYRMAYLSNKIITKLLDSVEEGYMMEYEDLLAFVRSLKSPTFFGEKLPSCDDEFFQLHSNFILSQIQSFDNEEITISGLPCVKHMFKLSGGTRTTTNRGVKGSKNTPQPSTLNTKSQTTPLVAELFESIFQQQMKTNRAAKKKMCACRNCQKNNCGNCERCEEMVSFGGKTPDNQVTCLERQCLKNLDGEVFLDDDEDNGKKKRVKTGVTWPRESLKTFDGKTYYDEVKLKMGVRERRVVPGTYLLITPDEEEHKSVPHYPARVLSLYSRTFQGKVLDLAHVQWFARGENTILGRVGDAREWYLVEECEDVLLSSVSRILNIEHLPIEDYTKWRKSGGTRGAIMKEDAGGKDGWWRMKYMPEFGRFEVPTPEEIELRGPGKCFQCDRRRVELNKNNVIVHKNGRRIQINGTWYEVGSFMLITDSTIRFRIPAKVPKTYPKSRVDPKLYPEHWRKPEVYEGDYNDVWEPFQIVRLEEVVQNGRETYIRVRKMYRPHDTHMTHEEARTKPLTELYWTEEIARMHPKEVANATNKVSMEDVVGHCYVRPLEHHEDEESLIKWTDDGEDRFYIASQYNADSKKFSTLSSKVSNALQEVLSKNPAPVLDEVSPLATMDIFAGCGGLSTGLGQAGVAQHKWAIEFWKPSADAYKKNNNKCKVFNEECNGLLKKAMDGDTDAENIPRKGDVDLLVGGPPCQGFSILNNFADRDYSKFKNSLIATYLSYCDFYRPKFFILENVRNLVQNEKGMVLKLILATLVKMGYQVGFQVLQAGHYGVAQTRRRLIILAASPDQALPLYPEPLHTFAGPHYLEVEVDGRKYAPTCTRPGAPRRALTVWDTISDLPPIQSGHDEPVARYNDQPQTHLQRQLRAKTGATVEDHICKNVTSLNQERINHIPKIPGSDWRDLPNKSALCPDGKMAKKLNYPYNKSDGSKGVCSCQLASERRTNYCDQDDRQSDTLIPWSVPHTADRHNNWKEVFGRAPWDGYFKTTITDPEPLGKQGQVLHPEQNRILSVRELARSQGFPDSYKFSGTIGDRHREIGNAVPPPLGKALGLEIRKAMLKRSSF